MFRIFLCFANVQFTHTPSVSIFQIFDLSAGSEDEELKLWRFFHFSPSLPLSRRREKGKSCSEPEETCVDFFWKIMRKLCWRNENNVVNVCVSVCMCALSCSRRTCQVLVLNEELMMSNVFQS
jgi:hypothetical protein